MRISREKVAENGDRIVEASRLFRESRFDGVGVDAIIRGLGHTHGGFYGHGNKLGAALARQRQRGGEADGWRSQLALEGRAELASGSDRGGSGPDAGRDPARAARARHYRRLWDMMRFFRRMRSSGPLKRMPP
jgi:hypothetical protein